MNSLTDPNDSSVVDIDGVSTDLSLIIFDRINYWSQVRLRMLDTSEFDSEYFGLKIVQIEDELIEDLQNCIRLKFDDDFIPLENLVEFIYSFQPGFYRNRH